MVKKGTGGVLLFMPWGVRFRPAGKMQAPGWFPVLCHHPPLPPRLRRLFFPRLFQRRQNSAGFYTYTIIIRAFGACIYDIINIYHVDTYETTSATAPAATGAAQ